MAAELQTPVATSFQLSGRKRNLQPLAIQGARNQRETSQAVTAFSGGRLEDSEGRPATAPGKKVIPKLENTFKAGPRQHDPNRYLPEQSDGIPASTEEKFELAAAEPEVEVEYGLQKRQRPSLQQPAEAESTNERPFETDTRKFKEDLLALPEVADAEAYVAMPVENFGEAMLRGMGWSEGRAVCKGDKKEVQAATYVRRADKLGLGAKPALPEAKAKRTSKPGDTSAPKKDLVYVDSTGRERNIRPIDAKLTERQAAGPQPGKQMQIVSGRHEGLRCQVLALEPLIEGHSAKASVRLLPSNQAVTVRTKELAERWEQQPKQLQQPPSSSAAINGHRPSSSFCEADYGSERTSRGQPEADRAADGTGGGNHKQHRPSSKSRQAAGSEQPKAASSTSEPPWLAEHIMVKVVDKHLSKGRLYLQKAEVIDVHAPTLCSLHFPETNETVDNVQQAQLETVIPRKEGSRVLILTGPSKGQKAWLLKRNSESGAAAVRPTMDPDCILRLAFDSISEYVGAMGEEE